MKDLGALPQTPPKKLFEKSFFGIFKIFRELGLAVWVLVGGDFAQPMLESYPLFHTLFTSLCKTMCITHGRSCALAVDNIWRDSRRRGDVVGAVDAVGTKKRGFARWRKVKKACGGGIFRRFHSFHIPYYDFYE